MRIIILLVLFFSFSTYCFEKDEIIETIWVEDEKVFSCSPKEIILGGSINISLGNGHFEELGIYRKVDKSWLFLVVGSPPDEMKSLMSPAELMQTSSIVIARNTTGFLWDQRAHNTEILSVVGKYTFYNSPTLESEVGGYKCTVIVRKQ